MSRGTLPNLAAKITDVAGENQQILPVVRVSTEEVVLMPLGGPLEPGELVEIKLQEGGKNIAVLDGEVVGSDEDGHVVIRLMNLDRVRREALSQALASSGAEEAPAVRAPGSTYVETPRRARQRKTTALMGQRTLEKLTEASRHSGSFPPPEGLSSPDRKGGGTR